MVDKLSSKRYKPIEIPLEDKNNSQKLSIDLIGYNKKILEIGTSTGYVTRILREHKNIITGIEIDEDAALIASQYCNRMIIGDVEALDFEKNFESSSFDVILCGDILEHLVNPRNLLIKLKKYLKDEGYLVVSLPNFLHGDVLLNLFNGDFRYEPVGLLDETHLRFFGLKNIYRLFTECGYRITNLQTTNIPIGATELKMDNLKVPKELLKFIELLPNSNVYQFVFTAQPSTKIENQEFETIDLENLVDVSIAYPIRKIRSEFEKKLNEKETIIETQQNSLEDLMNKEENNRSLVSSLQQELKNRVEEVYQMNQREIPHLKGEITELSHQLNQREIELDSKTAMLQSIQMSATWNMLMGFQRQEKLIFPQGTIRRRYYEIGIRGLRILSTEGLWGLGFRIKRLFLSEFVYHHKTNRLPVLETNIIGMANNMPISLDKPLVGSFVSPVDNLDEIMILTATYRRFNSNLHMIIREGSPEAPPIRFVLLPAGDIQDNNFSSFRFAPIKHSSKKRYFFDIQSEKTPAAAIWFNPSGVTRDVKLFADGNLISGMISFKCFSNTFLPTPYSAWILRNEPDENILEEMKEDVTQLRYKPLISIITPVWNTDEMWLRMAIESVRNQVYTNWELCLIDGGSTKEYVKKLLEDYALKDSRIKVKYLSENLGIAGNSNEALTLASGEFIGFLDHDDELAPFALFETVKLLNQNPLLSYIYSDEDKIDEKGNRCDPFFKPGWSPDLFLACNYLCHFSLIRKAVIEGIGGFRYGYDGSQDYDLFLRITEKLQTSEIVHIPKILYHWRIIPESASSSTTAKPYAYVAAKSALADSMNRRSIAIEEVVDGFWLGSYRIRYTIQSNPKVSIIIPSKDNVDVLSRCIQSIFDKTSYSNYDIIIIDNQSEQQKTLDYYETLKKNSCVRISFYKGPFNFSGINNFAVGLCESPYLLFLNNDTEIITPEWLDAMLEHAQREGVGAVGALLIYPNDTIQHAGLIIGNPFIAINAHKHLPAQHFGYFGRAKEIQNFSAVTGACLLMRKKLFLEIGGFDEGLGIAYNDVDLCLRLREKGYLIVFTPFAQLYHHESYSRGFEDTPEKKKRFADEVKIMRERWDSTINKGDPFYSPNLTLTKEDFSIKWEAEEYERS